MSSPHGIPGLQLRPLESYVERLAEIERDAASDETATLAYLVAVSPTRPCTWTTLRSSS
jgi:hypothetical protein